MANDVQTLVRMANQIADAFKASPPAEAAEGVANHIKSFWAPRLRHRLIEHAAAHPSDLLPLAIQAVAALKVEDAAERSPK